MLNAASSLNECSFAAACGTIEINTSAATRMVNLHHVARKGFIIAPSLAFRFLFQNPNDLLNGAPAAGCRRNSQDLFDLAEIADCLPFAPLRTDNETILYRIYLLNPIFVYRSIKRE